MTQPGSFNTSPAIQPPSVELDRLLQPARHFSHPREVVEDQTLSPTEKRAILSSWASDACAVESIPSLRQMPGSPAAVTFDEVMDALQQLDGTHEEPRSRRFPWRPKRRRTAQRSTSDPGAPA